MKKLLSSKKIQLGFTLMELLLVIAIIVIVIAVGSVSYSTANRTARNAQRQSDLQKISTALEEFFADHHVYPDVLTCLEGGSCGITNNNTYITQIPTDPQSGSPYSYTVVSFQSYTLNATFEGTAPPGYPLKSPTH